MAPNLVPVEKRDVVAAGARPPSTVVFAPLPTQNFSTWTVTGVRAALDEHENGSFASSAALVDAMGRDDRIKGCLGTRVKALVGRNGLQFSIQPSDQVNKARGKVVAREFERLWWRICPDATLAAIQSDATMLGVHLSRIVWELVDGKWLPTLQPVPAHALYFDDSGIHGPAGYYLLTSAGTPLYIDPKDPHWFLYTPTGPRAWLQGAVRALGLPYLMRQFSYRDWVRYCERHGMPIIKVSEPSSAEDADKSAFYTRLGKLGTESVIRLPKDSSGEGFDVDMLEAKDGSWQSFDSFIARLDVAVAVVLLGQNMTTDPQAHATGVQNARLVRQDYLDADVQPLSTELREQIVKPWGRFNVATWDDDLAPWPNWDTRPAEDQKAKAATFVAVSEAIGKLTDQGVPVDLPAICEQFAVPTTPGAEFGHGAFSHDDFAAGVVKLNEARARRGLEPVPGGDVLAKSASPAAKTPVGSAGQPLDELADPFPPARSAHAHDTRAAKDDGFAEGQAYADKLAASARDRASEVVADDLASVLTLIEQSTSYEDLQGRLLTAFRGMSPDKLAQVTEKTMLLAELAGRHAVLKDL